MSDFLVMRSFPNRREPYVEKVRSDGILMYYEARYVIVLDEEGNVVERINRSITYTGNYLVVLAPLMYKGWKINLSVVLEIGLSRSAPYKQYEKCFESERFAVKARCPVARLTDEKVIFLLPLISKQIKSIAVEETAHWKSVTFGGRRETRGKRRSSHAIRWKCGIFASIPTEEEVLCYAVHLLDFETRVDYLSQKVLFIEYWLRNYKQSSYSRKQLLSYAGAKKVADMVMDAEYPAHHLSVIVRGLSPHIRDLFDLCIRAYSPLPKEGEEYKELEEILGSAPPSDFYIFLHNKFELVRAEIKKGWRLHCYIWEKRDARRKTHAQNSLRFEIGLEDKDRDVLKNHEIAFLEKVFESGNDVADINSEKEEEVELIS